MIAPKELDNGLYAETTTATARKKTIVAKIVQRLADDKPIDDPEVIY